MFEKGMCVKLNATWTKASGNGIGRYVEGLKGTVRGNSRTPMCVLVLFSGDKRAKTFHQSFLEEIG